MDEYLVFYYLTYAVWGLGALLFFVTLLMPAPYGRYHLNALGPTIPNRMGWAIKESPGFFVFAAVFYLGDYGDSVASLIMGGLWLAHYFNRAFLMPLVFTKAKGRRMSVVVCVGGFLYNAFIAGMLGRWVSQFGQYSDTWVYEPHFLIGVAIFLVGMYINVKSDLYLVGLRNRKAKGYSIPHGGLFRNLTSPNYLGELIEWIGWAVLTWSTIGLALAFCVAAQVFPRSLSHRTWYRRKFTDYPTERKAIIPRVF